MASVPTFSLPPGFLGIERREATADFCVAGIPFDIGTTNRSGARFAPSAIRHASRMLVDGDHPVWWTDPAAMSVSDIGNFQIALGDIRASLELIERQAAAINHLVAFGGDHTVTLGLLRAAARRQGRPLALVQLDAHVDTWPDNFGQAYAHGSIIFRAIEERLIDPRRTVQVGIRSPVQKGVYDWTQQQGVTIIPAWDVHERGPKAIARRIGEIVGDVPVYLTVDIDVLDPAFAPGTGTPEIGGLASWQLQAILRGLDRLAFTGMDVVEVSPPYDVAEITALAAATAAWEYLALLGRAPRT
jgi:agmatinase